MAELKYTLTHEWVDSTAADYIVGITQHAQQLLGDLVYIELPEIGNEVNAGDELGIVESVKAASDFYAPISGTVVAVNQQLTENPALVNKDPYGAGWLVKIKASAPDELNDLLNAGQYEEEISEGE